MELSRIIHQEEEGQEIIEGFSSSSSHETENHRASSDLNSTLISEENSLKECGDTQGEK